MRSNVTAFVAATLVSVLGASILIAAMAPKRRQAPIRWVRLCDVSLDLAHGTLTARRTLTEDGERRYDDDRADWRPKDRDSDLAVSLNWNGGGDGIGLGRVALSLPERTDPPLDGRITFRRPTNASRDAPLWAGMRRTDNRTPASASLSLDDLMAFAADADTLDWRYDGGAARARIRRTGRIAMTPLREAAMARRTAGRKLTAMTADYADACPKAQDYSPLNVILQ